MSQMEQLNLIDLSGRVVKTIPVFDLITTQIDVSDMAKGTYFLVGLGSETPFRKEIVIQ